MFCTKCGIELQERDRFCSQCATPTGRDPVRVSGVTPLRLSRPVHDKKIAGVCAGVARYMGVDVTLVRVLCVVLALWPPGIGLIAYIICWIVMPKDPLLLPAAPFEPVNTTS